MQRNEQLEKIQGVFFCGTCSATRYEAIITPIYKTSINKRPKCPECNQCMRVRKSMRNVNYSKDKFNTWKVNES